MDDTGLTIGQAARLAGVSAKALRHYQRLGLIAEPARGANGYRRFRPADLLRVRRIRRLQALGLSLAQIGVVLGGPEGERALPAVLAELRAELDAQIAALQERRAAVDQMLADGGAGAIDRLPASSPTMRLLEAQVEPGLAVDPWLRAADQQLFDVLDTALGADPVYQARMAELAGLIAAHPADYRALLALGERLVALATADRGDPEVAALAADLRAARDTNTLLAAAGALEIAADPAVAGALGDMLGATAAGLTSPAQRRVLALAGIAPLEEADG